MNSKLCIETSTPLKKKLTLSLNSLTKPLLQLTGEKMELSPPLKTKDNVDLAGLSLLLVLLKELLLSLELRY